MLREKLAVLEAQDRQEGEGQEVEPTKQSQTVGKSSDQVKVRVCVYMY